MSIEETLSILKLHVWYSIRSSVSAHEVSANPSSPQTYSETNVEEKTRKSFDSDRQKIQERVNFSESMPIVARADSAVIFNKPCMC